MEAGLIDSHCHLDRLEEEPDAALERAREAGVEALLCVSINMENVRQVIGLARRYPMVCASVGVHPNERQGREAELQELLSLAEEPEVVAIGETGLDYFRAGRGPEWQQERFRLHIEAARESGKPLIVHTRDAAQDTLRIMREAGAAEAGGVMHCFTGDLETAQEAMEMGFYISFSGIITFSNAAPLREVARQIPDDRLLIETDAPYLAPVPHRGKPNHPAYLREVARCLAELRGCPPEEIARITTANFRALFRCR